jgi:hypothetical protein
MTMEPNYVYGRDRSVEAVKHIKTRVAMSKLYITINYFFKLFTGSCYSRGSARPIAAYIMNDPNSIYLDLIKKRKNLKRFYFSLCGIILTGLLGN